MYLGIILALAQYIAGVTINDASNLGFLTYNPYTQIQWLKNFSGPDGLEKVGPLC